MSTFFPPCAAPPPPTFFWISCCGYEYMNYSGWYIQCARAVFQVYAVLTPVGAGEVTRGTDYSCRGTAGAMEGLIHER